MAMPPLDPCPPPYGALFIDVGAIESLAARCRANAPCLPSRLDGQVGRFSEMARKIDPRHMLLDEEFDLTFRFALFGSLMEPLSELFACYSEGTNLARGRDDRFLVYLDVLTFTTRTLCAGIELFSAISKAATVASPAVRRQVAESSLTYEAAFSKLLGETTRVLQCPGLMTDQEARQLRTVVETASQALERSSP